MKLPGTYAAYAALMAVFGQTAFGIHLGFLFVNGITIMLLYLLGKMLIGPWEGVAAACEVFTIWRQANGGGNESDRAPCSCQRHQHPKSPAANKRSKHSVLS